VIDVQLGPAIVAREFTADVASPLAIGYHLFVLFERDSVFAHEPHATHVVRPFRIYWFASFTPPALLTHNTGSPNSPTGLVCSVLIKQTFNSAFRANTSVHDGIIPL
jgi:hypothetical protein